MTRIVIALKSNAAPWADLLQRLLPTHEVVPSAEALAGRPADYVLTGKPGPGVIAAIDGVKVVFSVNAGIEALLADGVVPPQVPIVRMVDPGLRDGMLEWVLAQVLAWHRNLFVYREQDARRDWRQLPEKLAFQRTVLVLGAGELGGPIARALAGLGFATRTWSRTGADIAGVTTFAGADRLVAAATGADAVINLLPLTPDTTDLVGRTVFDAMNPGGLLVNGGRGATVVDADLIAALDAGRLSMAALDVFRTEPLPAAHPFWAHPRIHVYPHVAALTHPVTAVPVIVENILAFEAGRPLRHVVDRARGY
jgi:glyoxylate/hydroxypyruvate reductase